MMLFALRRRIALAICPELKAAQEPSPTFVEVEVQHEPDGPFLRAWMVSDGLHWAKPGTLTPPAAVDATEDKGAPGPDEGHSAPGRDDLILQLRADQETLKDRIDDLEVDVSVLRAQLSLVEAAQWQLLSTPPSAPTPSDPRASEGDR